MAALMEQALRLLVQPRGSMEVQARVGAPVLWKFQPWEPQSLLVNVLSP